MQRFAWGAPVAPASVPPEWLAAAFAPERRALVLAAEPGGWFGGTQLVACDPVLDESHAAPNPFEPYDPAHAEVGAHLDRALASETPVLAAALLEYEGASRVAVFERGLVRDEQGWRRWGDWTDVTPPAVLPVTPPVVSPSEGQPLIHHTRSRMDEAEYVAGVREVHEAVARGDVYLLNLCRRLSGEPVTDPHTTFATLIARSAGSAMAAGWIRPDLALLSVSPERFISLEGREARIEPIKGTRPRGTDATEDARLAQELSASDKERAENVMVVDLERNDLGRVCEAGSVLAPDLLRVETNAYCHQLVSTVAGTLRADAGCAELLSATFPCGSVTGAPKPSAMHHIARLEVEPRGVYTGSLVVAIPGRLDSSVLIRTAVIGGGALSYGVGCGVTIDSDPAEEWRETILKAAPLLGG